MKIDRIHLKNIGVFADCELVFPAEKPAGKAEIHVFTGVNGSGKSTMLYALASAFYPKATHRQEPMKNLLASRFRGGKLLCELNFRGNEIFFRLNDGLLAECNLPELHDYWRANEPGSFGTEVSFGAFSYSGFRSSSSEKIQAIKESQQAPLFDSLNFFKDSKTKSINQWIANTISKKSLSRDKGNGEAVKRYGDNLTALSKAIEQITGNSVEFDFNLEPLDLLVELKNARVSFDALPDGLRSLLSWLGDLLMRLDELKWTTNTPILEREFILFLDEIEVHLHPAWQRKVLPVVQNLFPNAQIFLSTHSPFVVNSVDGAWIYKFELDENGDATIAPPVKSEDATSYRTVLRETFDIHQDFGGEAGELLETFYGLRDRLMQSEDFSENDWKKIEKLAYKIARQSLEMETIVSFEMRQLQRILKQTTVPA